MSIKFRASSVGNLLTGGNAVSDKQRERLNALLARQGDKEAKPLTERMQQELDELIVKRDAPYQFGASAKSYIRDCWRAREYDYVEPLVSNEILKGWLVEDESIGVLTRQCPGGFRVKNDVRYEDGHFSGEPDIITETHVEDVKSSFNLRTFMEVEHPSSIYHAQAQVYMALTGIPRFRLAYVLVDTPYQIVVEEQKKLYYRFFCNEEDPNYKQAVKEVAAMHTPSKRIDEEKRIKIFEISYNEMYIERLRKRVEAARVYYDTLTL